jgi:hypothetical protein
LIPIPTQTPPSLEKKDQEHHAKNKGVTPKGCSSTSNSSPCMSFLHPTVFQKILLWLGSRRPLLCASSIFFFLAAAEFGAGNEKVSREDQQGEREEDKAAMGFLMMPTYITREVSKIWRRIVLEVSVEIPILIEKWPYILFGVIFQYIHGVGARLAYYLHRPGPLLHDLGFELLPELGLENAYISETVFASVFVSFFLWTFHPFVFYSKRFYTVVLWSRVLVVLVVSFLISPRNHYLALKSVSALNSPQHSERNLCENMKIIIIIISYTLNNFTTHMTISL